jgi:hypothetical protein
MLNFYLKNAAALGHILSLHLKERINNAEVYLSFLILIQIVVINSHPIILCIARSILSGAFWTMNF